MGKIIFILLVFLLCLRETLQNKEKRKNQQQQQQQQDSWSSAVRPRVFFSDLQEELVHNGTPAPPGSPPALKPPSNATTEYLRGALSTRVFPVVYLLVVAVGIPANVAILGTMASRVRTVSSAILYCSLAVSDLLLLLSLLFKAHYHLHGNHWVLGEAACRAVTACFYGNLYCSAQTLACISVKRYLAVVHPFRYKSLPKRAVTAWVCVAVWGVFSAAVVPELLVQQSYRVAEPGAAAVRITCHDVLPLYRDSHVLLLYYNVALTLLGLLLPLGVTVGCYVRIVSELKRSQTDWALYIQASSLVFAIFLLCFTPAGLLHLLHHVQLAAYGADGLYVHFKVAVCLCCLHACLDPFLFVLMSRSAGSRNHFRPFKGITLSLSA